MDTKKEKKNILSNGAVQTLLASLFCIILGLVVGYVVLLVIQSTGCRQSNHCNFAELPVLPETGSRSGIFRKHPCENSTASDVYPVRFICL